MQKKMSLLTKDQVAKLMKTFDILSINKDFDFVYEKQIPNMGLALIEGEIELFKKTRILGVIAPSSLLGAYQLLHQEPVKFGCRIKKDSKVILISKSDLMSLKL